MKLHLIFKYIGMLAGIVGMVMILLGTIGFFSGEIFNVRYFANYFWFANIFFVFGIFGMVVYIACKDKEK